MAFVSSMGSTIHTDLANKRIKITPKSTTLVGDDTFLSPAIFIKPLPQDQQLTLHWKLLSKDFKTDGKLIINIKSNVEVEYVDQLEEARPIVNGEIVDYIISKDHLDLLNR